MGPWVGFVWYTLKKNFISGVGKFHCKFYWLRKQACDGRHVTGMHAATHASGATRNKNGNTTITSPAWQTFNGHTPQIHFPQYKILTFERLWYTEATTRRKQSPDTDSVKCLILWQLKSIHKNMPLPFGIAIKHQDEARWNKTIR